MSRCPVNQRRRVPGRFSLTSHAGLVPREPTHCPRQYAMAFVAFLWQVPPFRPVLPVLPSNIPFAVNKLALARHLHTVEVVGSNPAVPTIPYTFQSVLVATAVPADMRGCPSAGAAGAYALFLCVRDCWFWLGWICCLEDRYGGGGGSRTFPQPLEPVTYTFYEEY